MISAGNSGFHRLPWGSPPASPARSAWARRTKTTLSPVFPISSSLTTLLAPGGNINSTVFFDGYQPKSGTSMAAPHVAGAVAVLKQALPTASVTQIRNALTSTGPLIADARGGGSVSKRRLDVYYALCALITCDSDDYKYLSIPQTVNGTISPANDRDHYFLYNTAGTRVTIEMARTSGNLDPYLELYDPTGVRVALNNNGGSGNDALINNYTLQRTGRYQIIARGSGAATGAYTLSTLRRRPRGAESGPVDFVVQP
ncbi:MAG: S8 family serine peptidase [Caldilineaceae bacterium]